MHIDSLIAIDTHVHIEPDSRDTAADAAARQYFGEKGPSLNRQELVDYYRSRKIGCVIFSVDERMTGRKQVPNEDVLALAKKNSDVMIAFASVDPTRGAEAVSAAERLIAAGVRGFKLHPPLQKFRANDRIAYPVL
jgi:predicted TIM-barrel fold metal-dependent hydrolase